MECGCFDHNYDTDTNRQTTLDNDVIATMWMMSCQVTLQTALIGIMPITMTTVV